MGKNAQWLTIGEAAKHVGVSRDTLRRWEKKGKIKPRRSPTNRRFYTKEELNQLIGKKDVKSTEKTPAEKTKGKLSPLARLALAAILSSIAAVLIATSLVLLLTN